MTAESLAEEPRVGAKRDLITSARNAMKLGGSLMVTWSVAMVVRFYLPRHLGPEGFGSFNFAESFAGSFSVFLGLGIEPYIQKEISVRPEHASDFFGGVVVLRLALSLLLWGVMAGVLITTHRPMEVVAVALVFAASQFFSGLNGTLATMLQASTSVGKLAITTVVAKILWGLALAIGIWLRAPLFVLAMPILFAEALSTAIILPIVRRVLSLTFKIDARAVKLVVIASLPFFVNAIAISLGGRLNVSMLEFLADSREVGWFSAANNLAGLAMLLSPLVSWVLMPLLARAAKRSQDEVFAIVRRAIEGLVLVSMPLTMMISLGADVWIRLVFGPSFAPAAMSLRVLAPIFVLTYAAILLATALIVLERSWTLTLTSLGALAVLPLLVLFFVHLTKPLGLGGAGVGAAMASIAMEALVVTMFCINVGRRAFDRRSVLAIGKSIGVTVSVVILHQVAKSALGVAVLAIDVVAYAVLAVVVGAVNPRELVSGVREVLVQRRAAKNEAIA